ETEKRPQPSVDLIIIALKVSNALIKNDLKKGVRLIEFAARNSQLSAMVGPGRGELIRIHSLSDPSDSQLIGNNVLIRQNDQWRETIENLLRSYAESNDLTNFKFLVKWLTGFPESVGNVKILFSRNCAIKLENGSLIDGSAAPYGVTIRGPYRE